MTQPLFTFFITGYSVFFNSKVLSERDLLYTLYSNQHKRAPTFVGLQVSTAVRCAIQFYTENKTSPSKIGNCSYPDSPCILSQRSILCKAYLVLDSGLPLSQTYHIPYSLGWRAQHVAINLNFILPTQIEEKRFPN